MTIRHFRFSSRSTTKLLAFLMLAASPACLAAPLNEVDPELTGPLTALVDPHYATVEAARKTLVGDLNTPVNPVLYGHWTVLTRPTLVRAIRVTALRTGKVLIMAGSGNDARKLASGTFTAELWDPTMNAFRS